MFFLYVVSIILFIIDDYVFVVKRKCITILISSRSNMPLTFAELCARKYVRRFVGRFGVFSPINN